MQCVDSEGAYSAGVGEDEMSSILSFIGGFLAGGCVIRLFLHSDTTSIIMALGFGAGIAIICYNFWIVVPKELGDKS